MPTTRVHQHVAAPRAVVYRLLLDPTAIALWKVPDGMTARVHTFEACEGGALRVSLTYVAPTGAGKSDARTDTYHGRFVRLVPDERVVEADEFETDDPAMRGEMLSTITLADAPGGGTDVVGEHEQLPSGVDPQDNETGWRMALSKLAALAESDPTRLIAAANEARTNGSSESDAERRIDALFGSGRTLAVYGTLAPGQPNHHVVAPLGGEWTDGVVEGELLPVGWGAALGYKAFRPVEGGATVAVKVLTSPLLAADWPRLDEFEGPGYRRILVPVFRPGAVHDRRPFTVANLYAAAP